MLRDLRGLSRAYVAVLRAELATAAEDLTASGRTLAAAVALAGAAAALTLLIVGVLVYVAIAALSLWLPAWGAGLVVAAALAIVALLIGLAARARLRRVEGPVTVVRRRVDDHLAWWSRRVGDGAPGAPAERGAVEPEDWP